MFLRVFTAIVYLVFILIDTASTEDFYEILGVPQDASIREIRKAFKQKALKLHPDKKQGDPDAHSEFVKMNRIYEVLKDEELRKTYDRYGEEALEDSKKSGSGYHSWSYYHNNFGIYDDDPEVVTLSRQEFAQSVDGSQTTWFINFYHPMCSHCHTLAPVWRNVAKELEGVVRIGAVNCDDDFALCSSQGIRGYPSLLAYPGGVKYTSEKTQESLVRFILNRVSHTNVVSLTKETFKEQLASPTPWLVVFHPHSDEAREFQLTEKKLAIALDGLVRIGRIDCAKEEICDKDILGSEMRYFESENATGTRINSLDVHETIKEVFGFLPLLPLLSQDEAMKIRKNLSLKKTRQNILILFEGEESSDYEIKKLPHLLRSIVIARVRCSEAAVLCDDLFISKTPAFILFKLGGGYEVYHGRLSADDIANFVMEANLAQNFRVLTPNEFPGVLESQEPWFVDFYAPWCPPCMKLLPEVKKASRYINFTVNFGSIDCTVHAGLCSSNKINQYPTTILYNNSVPHQYFGHQSASHIVEFIKDTINPVVKILDSELHTKHILQKPLHETWIVDYFANWCHHCQSMAPEYRKFARAASSLKDVYVAQVDCAVHRATCQKQGIHSYPSVRIYPVGTIGVKGASDFNGWSRDAASFRQWLHGFLPSTVVNLNDHTFEQMLRSPNPWLVDFYAPWCGHCHSFAPNFEAVAEVFHNKVHSGKVNCEQYPWLCRGASIRAYPSVRLYTGGRPDQRQDPNGIDVKSLEVDDIIEFIHKRVPHSHIHDEL